MKKIFVGMLSAKSTEADLLGIFGEFGPVLEAKIMKDSITQCSRKFGYVRLENDARARSAIRRLNGYALNGKNITVSEAASTEKQSDFHYRFS